MASTHQDLPGMAAELEGARNIEQPISPTEIEDTSENPFNLVAGRHNSTIDSIPPDGYDPNTAGPSSTIPVANTVPMNIPMTSTQTHDTLASISRVESPPTVTRRTTETQPVISQTGAQGDSSSQQRLQRDSDTTGLIPRGGSLSPAPVPSPDPPVEYQFREPWWNRRYLRWANPKRRYWCYILVPITIALGIIVIVIVVLWQKSDGNNISITLNSLAEVTLQQSNALPRSNSGLGATIVALGTFFSAAALAVPDTMVAYTDDSGRLCVRKKSDLSWLNNVQCIEGALPKPDTPISVLDWIGGPSVYFITTSNTLSGIDYIPQNSTWKLSSLASQKRIVHKSSQLASVTWLNGTSAWLYYQDTSSQLREFGIDDYRDSSWRDGSLGPLGLAQDGSGIGASRWLSGTSEVMEIFCQATNGAIHGRVYRNSVWLPDSYSVDGTPGTITQGASMTATTLNQANGSMVLLAYVDSSGFLTVQSRATINVTSVYSGFSSPKRLVEGDGKIETGLAAVGSQAGPKVYFVVNQKILELSSTDVVMGNWTTVEVTSA